MTATRIDHKDGGSTSTVLPEFDTGPFTTPEGGNAARYFNNTGATIKQGTVLEIDASVERGVKPAVASSKSPIAVAYRDILPGTWGPCVYSGLVYTLIKNGTASVRGNWCVVSDVAGRIDATATAPPGGDLQAAEVHFGECGHTHTTANAGTDVLVLLNAHFN